MEERRWSGEEYQQARNDGAQLEQLMRSILKLFADGCLTYRSRTLQGGSVETKSDRLKRVRRGLDASLEPGVPGSAAIAS